VDPPQHHPTPTISGSAPASPHPFKKLFVVPVVAKVAPVVLFFVALHMNRGPGYIREKKTETQILRFAPPFVLSMVILLFIL
jgi:hypothetical protein